MRTFLARNFIVSDSTQKFESFKKSVFFETAGKNPSEIFWIREYSSLFKIFQQTLFVSNVTGPLHGKCAVQREADFIFYIRRGMGCEIVFTFD